MQNNSCRNILVVDDEKPVLNLAAKVLEDAGYAVKRAESGRQAISIYTAESSSPLDLLLTNVDMNGMDGLRLAKELKQQFPVLRIIFMSGNSPENFRDREGFQLRQAFLEKPFSIKQLLLTVRSVLKLYP